MIPLIAATSGGPSVGAGSGYQIAKSLRLRALASASASRTPGSAGSQTAYTVSMWVRRSRIGVVDPLLSADLNGSNYGLLLGFGVMSNGGDALEVGWANAGTVVGRLGTVAQFRDVTAWMHIVVVVDTAQATASERLRLYVNGVRVTALASAVYPPQNAPLLYWNGSGQAHYLGRYNAGNLVFDGMLAEVIHVDGQTLAPSSFGRLSPTTGCWEAIAYAGTFAGNSFYLPFSTSTSTAALLTDASGRSNNFTPANISVTTGATFDQLNDTPTNTFPILSPSNQNVSITAGGLRASAGAVAGGTGFAPATMAISSGKWIFDWTIEAITGPGGYIAGPGLLPAASYFRRGSIAQLGDVGLGWGFGCTWSTLTRRFNGVSTAIAGAGAAVGDTFSLLVDMDAGNAWLARNGVVLAGGDPVAGTSPLVTGITGPVLPAFQTYFDASNTLPFNVNFGQRPMAMSVAGFQPICTQNLPTPRIIQPSTFFDAVTWIGTGANQNIPLGFSPDLVWAKRRNAADNHFLYDRQRGLNKELQPNTSANEATTANGLDFLSTASQLTLTGSGYFGGGGGGTPPFVAWLIRDTPAAGLDIVTYTGSGVPAAIPHDLGTTPAMILVKTRTASGVSNWVVYHKDQLASPATAYLLLNGVAAPTVSSAIWNNTPPTSSNFYVGTSAAVNEAGSTYVAYVFAEIPAFSRFCKYLGNEDGPFVWCGFRPRFVLIKRVDASNANTTWIIHDAARQPANPMLGILPIQAAAETNTTTTYVEFYASGFRVRVLSDDAQNQPGASYIVAAFAEAPFKYATAR